MHRGQGGTARALGLLVLGVLLAGCMQLTDQVPGPRDGAEPTLQPSHRAEPAPLPEIRRLLPGKGEAVVTRMSVYRGSAKSSFWLGPGETTVRWTCDGFGPIDITFSDGRSYGARCEDFEPNEVRLDSFRNESPRRLFIAIDARERQLWQVLVTQQAGRPGPAA